MQIDQQLLTDLKVPEQVKIGERCNMAAGVPGVQTVGAQGRIDIGVTADVVHDNPGLGRPNAEARMSPVSINNILKPSQICVALVQRGRAAL